MPPRRLMRTELEQQLLASDGAIPATTHARRCRFDTNRGAYHQLTT